MKNNLTPLTDTVSAVKTDFLFKTRLLPTHVFILKTGNGLILFDTGSPGCGRMIVESLKTAGLDPGFIRAVCLSHWHGDHTGSLAEIIETIKPTGRLDIFIGPADLPLLTDGKAKMLRLHPFLKLPVFHSPGRVPPNVGARIIPLDRTGCLKLENRYGIKAIATPGHTPGHTAYLHHETQSLFSGCALSLLKPDQVGLVPIFYDRKKQIRSGKRLADMAFRYLFSSHIYLRSDEIPLEKRQPCTGRKGIIAEITGQHLLFRIL